MRCRGLLLIAFLAPWCRVRAQQAAPAVAPRGAALSTFDTRSTLARIVRDTTLSNGLEVISVENHTVPLATVEVVVRTGAFTQDPGTEGVPHLFEHMLFRSYVGLDRASFDQTATNLDALHNGTTQEELVSYWVTLPSTYLDRAIELMADLVRDPAFTQETLDEERRVVLNEFGREQSDPDNRLERQVEHELWTTGWGRKTPLGEIEAINSATPKLLNEIYHRYYVPNNAALIVSGDVTAAQVASSAQRHFVGWHRGPDPFAAHPVPPIPPLLHSSAVILEDDVQSITIRIEWQGPSANRDVAETYAADVLSSVVNAPASAFQRNLVDNGLFTSASLSYSTLDHVGPITLYATTVLDSLPHALEALATELAALGSPYAFSDDELTNSKRTRAVDAAFELDHPTEMAQTVGYYWSVLGLDYYMNYTDRMAAVTRADLRRYVERYMHRTPAIVGALVPRGRTSTVQSSITAFLNQLGASPPVAPRTPAGAGGP